MHRTTPRQGGAAGLHYGDPCGDGRGRRRRVSLGGWSIDRSIEGGGGNAFFGELAQTLGWPAHIPHLHPPQQGQGPGGGTEQDPHGAAGGAPGPAVGSPVGGEVPACGPGRFGGARGDHLHPYVCLARARGSSGKGRECKGLTYTHIHTSPYTQCSQPAHRHQPAAAPPLLRAPRHGQDLHHPRLRQVRWTD